MRGLLRWFATRKRGRKSPAPMPIIVGSPRSGTTLLRFMLDAHPDLAIPPETGFLGEASLWWKDSDPLGHFFHKLTTFPEDAPGWQDFGIPTEDLWRRLQAESPTTASDAIRLFYRMYAARCGKSRWGDKTPLYCRGMPAIEALLPEARFIHIVRDGRDVAISLRSRFFSPGRDMETQANYWRENVMSARSAATQCRHYREVRYENLLQDTEDVLRNLCDFLQLAYCPDMLRYHERTPERLQEHKTRLRADGSVLISHEDRLRQQAATQRAPDPSRIGVWRNTLTDEEILTFERVAGDLLEELGYPLAGAYGGSGRCLAEAAD